MIGVAAPLLLISLRLLQGLALGGEWAGAALLSTEHAPTGKRGRYGMSTQLGMGTGLVLANLVFLLSNNIFSNANTAFLQWGWRIPFVLSAALIGVALYLRLRVEESPVFAAIQRDTGVPFAALMHRQARQVLLAAGVMVGGVTLVYQVGTFFTHYAVLHLGYSAGFVLLVGVIGGLCSVALVAVSAVLSDTYGRRRIVAIGYIIAVPWSFAVFPLIAIGNQLVFGVAVVFTYAITEMCLGPMASFIPEIFAPHYRYTGAALSHSVGCIIGGAVPPVLSEPLLASYGGWSIGVMMAGLAAVSLVSVLLLRETATPSVQR